MVMKVCQEINVDGVTIFINSKNELEAVGSSLEFEEISIKKDEMNAVMLSPFELEGSHRYHERKINLTRLFKLKGADLYLFGGELKEIVRPLPPDPVFRYIAPNDGIFRYIDIDSIKSFSFGYTNYHLTEGWDYEDRITEHFPSEKYDYLFPEEGYRFYVEYDGTRKEFKLVKAGNELELYDFETGKLLEGDVELGTYRKSITSNEFTSEGVKTQEHNFETTLFVHLNRQNASISIIDKDGRGKSPQLHYTEPYESYNMLYSDIVTIGRYD